MGHLYHGYVSHNQVGYILPSITSWQQPGLSQGFLQEPMGKLVILWWFNGDLMGLYPLVMTNSLLLKMVI